MTVASYEESIARMERFLDTRPAVVAHDLHPEYASTAYALSRRDVVHVGVQHHHAHVASAMAEHHLEGPVIGVAYDGTGWGTDGTAWGGEILLADYRGFERLATLRPIALAGGDAAVRQTWRTALALLDDAYDGEPPAEAMRLLDGVAPRHLLVVRQMIAAGVNATLAHGVGRYFDALGALLLGRTESRYEGQVAMQLGFAAADATGRSYPFTVEWNRAPWELDLRPLVRATVEDLAARTPPARIAAGFHDTLVTATADLVRAARERIGRVPVVLTGGCFQNARLAEGMVAALSPDFEVYLHRQVPPGDGGIALGQAVIANAVRQSPPLSKGDGRIS
jgi:hydrogenase maturation protein HypF